MIKKLVFPTLLFVFMSACGPGKVDVSDFSATGAKAAAEHFYSLLAKEQAQAYVDNIHQAGQMDSSKYTQFVALMEQFLHEEKELRGGILFAKAHRDSMMDSVAMVFLNVQFGDSTREQIMLPLIYSQGRWWVR